MKAQAGLQHNMPPKVSATIQSYAQAQVYAQAQARQSRIVTAESQGMTVGSCLWYNAPIIINAGFDLRQDRTGQMQPTDSSAT